MSKIPWLIIMKTIIMPAVALLLLFGCICGPLGTIGSGNIVSEERDVGTFHTVSNSGSATVYLTAGTGKMVVKAEDNLVPLVGTEVSNGVLSINTSAMIPTESVEVYVPVGTSLRKISNSGAGNMQSINLTIAAEDLSVTMSGAGNMQLSLDVKRLATAMSGVGNLQLEGKANEHKASMSGTGNLQAFKLITENTTITSSGVGNAEIYASNSIEATLSGMGNLRYKGDPKEMDTKISGFGNIQKVS